MISPCCMIFSKDSETIAWNVVLMGVFCDYCVFSFYYFVQRFTQNHDCYWMIALYSAWYKLNVLQSKFLWPINSVCKFILVTLFRGIVFAILPVEQKSCCHFYSRRCFYSALSAVSAIPYSTKLTPTASAPAHKPFVNLNIFIIRLEKNIQFCKHGSIVKE